MIRDIEISLVLGLILAACACVEQTPATTCAPVSAGAAKSCICDFPSEWHYVVGSQVQEVDDAELLADATAFVQGIFGQNSQLHYDEARIHTLQHPDDPETMLVEFDLPFGVHHLIGTTLLQHTGEEWMELTVPPYPSVGYHAEDADLMGYVWECDGWSLYLGVRNTEFYSGQDRPELAAFYRSRDSGMSWMPEQGSIPSPWLSLYGVSWNRLEPPDIAPPEGTVLATAFYDQERERLTRFAWTEDTRTLYAFSYSFIPTPESPRPSVAP